MKNKNTIKRSTAFFLAFVLITFSFSFGIASSAEDLWVWPVPGSYAINSLDYYPDGTLHNRGQCIDIGNNGYDGAVRLDIVSATSGTVDTVVDSYEDKASSDGSWGNCVIVKYGSYYIVYAHLKSVSVVKGQTLSAGDIIGKMGTSGQSTGVHLHMQVYPVGSVSGNTDVHVFDKYISNKEYIPRFRFLSGLESKSVRYGEFIRENYNSLFGSYYIYSKPVIDDTGVWLDKKEINLEIGESVTLGACVLPQDAYYNDLSFSSSDNAVVSVSSSGVITGKKRGNAKITVKSHSGCTAVCIVTVLGAPLSVSGKVFSDVREGDWFYDKVKYVVENKVYYGTTNTTFSPNAAMTRAMFASVLGRMSGESVSEYKDSHFLDVDMTEYYGKYVAWAEENGIVYGTGSGMFEPDELVTREQMCSMFVRYMKHMGYSTSASGIEPFDDDEKISSWAKNDVYICKSLGIVSGKGGGMFDPSSGATRAEVATVIFAFDKNVG